MAAAMVLSSSHDIFHSNRMLMRCKITTLAPHGGWLTETESDAKDHKGQSGNAKSQTELGSTAKGLKAEPPMNKRLHISTLLAVMVSRQFSHIATESGEKYSEHAVPHVVIVHKYRNLIL